MVLTSKLLAGKVALITGCSQGIGKGILEMFAQNGAAVFANDVVEGSLDSIATALTDKYQVEITPLYFDVSNSEQVKQAFDKVKAHSEKLDVLVNNAGIMIDALLPMISPDILTKLFSVNVFGTIYCMQYASRIMMKQKQGSIINLASIVGVEGNIGQVAYSGTKAAVVGLTKSAAKELARYNVRVNAIAPGFIDTAMARSIPEQAFTEKLNAIKLGRIGTPEDIAGGALYLASDLASYVTGQVIGVNGGMLV